MVQYLPAVEHVRRFGHVGEYPAVVERLPGQAGVTGRQGRWTHGERGTGWGHWPAREVGSRGRGIGWGHWAAGEVNPHGTRL